MHLHKRDLVSKIVVSLRISTCNQKVPSLQNTFLGAAVLNAFTTSSQKGFQAFKTFGDSIKTAAGNAGMSALALGGGKKALPRDKFEKKMTEEIQRMFNGDGPGGFYFSPTGDLTRRSVKVNFIFSTDLICNKFIW